MKPFIVAEMSANHLGSLDRALRIVEAAAQAGASAIKLQTYDPEEMAFPGYVIPSGPWAGRDLRDLYREAHTPYEWHVDIFQRAAELGIEAFSTPFSKSDVDFLEGLGCPRYKISSFELVDLPLIRHVAQTGKPMIMSTGMANHREIAEAVFTARINQWHPEITLLRCVSAYPASAADAQLNLMADMGREFMCGVGLSDHSPGIGVAVAAVASGATVIEKHLTLSRADGGPDASFSLEPSEFAEMVVECNRAHQAVDSDTCYGHSESEQPQLGLRRSLYFTRPLYVCDVILPDCVKTARPALGLMPRELDNIIGRKLKQDVKAGTPVTWEVIA